MSNASDGGFFTLSAESGNPPDWYNDNYAYRREITIDSSQIPSDLAYFPICVNITDTDLRGKIDSDGYGILFTINSVKMFHEIEVWNGTSGQLVAWLAIPFLNSSSDTTLYMYYGNMQADNQENPTLVWDDDFIAVYHLSDVLDSTSNNYDLTNSGATLVSGKIGNCYDFETGEDDYMSQTSFFDISTESTYTMETWFEWENTYNYAGVTIGVTTGNDWDRTMSIIDAASSDTWKAQIKTNGGTSRYAQGGGGGSATGFHYVTGLFNTSTAELFTDGVSRDTDTSQTINFANIDTDHLHFGKCGDVDNNYFDGLVDEVRISKIIRSSDWIKTTYNSLYNATDGGFCTFGAESGTEPLWYNNSWTYKKPITINATQIDTDVAGFTFCLNLSSDSNLATYALANGNDILFTNIDNSIQLNHEIELYNNSTGRLVAWVRIPYLNSSTDTEIYMYFNNSNSPNQQNPTKTWDKYYELVIHGNLEANNVPESSNNRDGVRVGLGITSVDSVLGKGLEGDGTTSYITLPADIGNVEIYKCNAEVTVGMYFTSPLTKTGEVVTFNPYGAAYNTYLKLDNGQTGGTNIFHQRMKQGGSWYTENIASAFIGNVYTEITETYDDTNGFRSYKNGVIDTTDSTTHSLNAYSATNLFMGYTSGSLGFEGIIDEFRVSSIQRSDNYINVVYNTINNATDGGFFTLGIQEGQLSITPTSPEDIGETTAMLTGILYSDSDVNYTVWAEYGLTASYTDTSQHFFYENTSLVAGLPDTGRYTKPAPFFLDGTLRMIVGEQDEFFGFQLTNSSWTENTSLISGLPSTAFAEYTPTIFELSGTIYCIYGRDDGKFYGLEWDGTTWAASGINAGLADVGVSSSPYVFTQDGTLCLISGNVMGTFVGYDWGGAAWSSNATLIAGLVDVGSKSKPGVFAIDDDLFLIAQDDGYKWNGSGWDANTTIMDNDAGTTSFYHPAFIYVGNTLQFFDGLSNGNIDGYSKSFYVNGSTCSALVSNLLRSTIYHYRLVVSDGSNLGYSSDYTFRTMPPGQPTNVSFTEGSNNIFWTKGISADYTLIRRGATKYPYNITDGTFVYNGTGTSTIDATIDEPFYTLWSYNVTYNYYGDPFYLLTVREGTITTNTSTNITASNSTLHGYISDDGSGLSITRSWFEWGKTTNYGNSTLVFWETNTSIVSGLGDVGNHASPTIFNKYGIWSSIVGEEAFGRTNGFEWTGNTWISNSSIKSGIPDVGSKAKPTAFQANGTWYCIVGENSGGFNGFKWNDATDLWEANATITPPSAGGGGGVTVFTMDGIVRLIATGALLYSGSIYGYDWNGSGWSANTTLVSGVLSGVDQYAYGFYTKPTVFKREGEWYLLFGSRFSNSLSYNWNGTSWKWSELGCSGIPTIGYGMPCSFEMNAIQYVVFGNSGGTCTGFSSILTTNPLINSTLTNLEPGTTYHYRAVMNNSNATVYGADMTFTTLPIAPIVSTEAATNITLNAGTLNADLPYDGGNCSSYFEWGTTISYGNTTTGQSINMTNISYPPIVDGLGSVGNRSKPSVHEINGTLRCISGLYNGTFAGWDWDGSSWISNSSIVAGLGDVGDYSTASLFQMNDTVYLIGGEYEATINGWQWNGTGWESNGTIVPAKVGASSYYSTPYVFNMSGTMYAIVSDSFYHTVAGRKWNGSAWITYAPIVSGIDDPPTHTSASACSFNVNGTQYLIISGVKNNVTGYSWNGTTWVKDTTATIGIINTGSFAQLTSFNMSGKWYIIAGRLAGDFVGYLLYFNTGTTFNETLTGLSPGTTYHYRAVASNSNTTVYGVDMAFLTYPGAPTNFRACPINADKINLTWTKNDGANTTYIERSLTPGPWTRGDKTEVYNQTGTSYFDTGLVMNTTYYYQAWSCLMGSTLYSTDNVSANATVQHINITNATNVQATTATLHGLFYGNGSATTGFYYGIECDCNHTTFDFNVTYGAVENESFSKDISGLSPSNCYCFQAWAQSSGGFCILNGTNLSFLTRPSGPPGGLTVTDISVTNVSLSWTNTSDATASNVTQETIIRYSTTGYPLTPTSGTLGYNGTAENCTISGLTMDSRYYFSAWTHITASCSGTTFHMNSSAYSTVSDYTTGGVYNMTVRYENLSYGPVNLSEYGPHNIIIHYYGRELDVEYGGTTHITFDNGVVTNETMISFNTTKMHNGSLSFSLNKTIHYIEFNWNDSTDNINRCNRIISPVTNQRNITFYIRDDLPVYGEGTVYMNGSIIKYLYSFVDETGKFKYPNNPRATIFTYNDKEEKQIIHSEYFDDTEAIHPWLVYEKKYYIGVDCDLLTYERIGTSPASENQNPEVRIPYNYLFNYSFFDIIQLDVGWTDTGFYVDYLDTTYSTTYVSIDVYGYYNHTLLYSANTTLSDYNFTYTCNTSNDYIWIINTTINDLENIYDGTYTSQEIPIFSGMEAITSADTIDDMLTIILGRTPLHDTNNPDIEVPWTYIMIFALAFIVLTSLGKLNAFVGTMGVGLVLALSGGAITGLQSLFSNYAWWQGPTLIVIGVFTIVLGIIGLLGGVEN